MGYWVVNFNRINWWLITEPNISEVDPFSLIVIWQERGLKGYVCHFVIPIQRMLNIMMGIPHAPNGRVMEHEHC